MNTPLVNAVLQRRQLPDTIRARLYGPPRDQWREHPHYLISDARALQRNHNSLKRQARQYHGALTHLINQPDARRDSEENRQLRQTLAHHGRTLLKNLHSHHGFEDSSVFPVLRLHHPRLQDAFTLLENDHQALDGLLADIDMAIADVPAFAATPATLEKAHGQAAQLDALLHRHMDDEEDILVPIYLASM
ncbi:hypothetical protein A11A3_04275 [Alcanivorax hongdengensis A-11-3]|uniref:Hemerythrin-like domain-containing protein n=1 Tax=Alcanivorax hongdengensis A-11-3 TaxID=1177179 RepID=L0WH47_9GAMM|nr:hemerythrin domain-containing protein [Alcanivorax hongdengensis]EKF75165.1 hypothetical protein A11A3_04275 [Alcanivorax hongdengensis A-11-3]